MADARTVANWFIRRASLDGVMLSRVKLCKMVCIAHAYCLNETGSRLFKNKLEAWTRGPMVPDVLHALEPEDAFIKDGIPGFFADTLMSEDVAVLEAVWSQASDSSSKDYYEFITCLDGVSELHKKTFGVFSVISDDTLLGAIKNCKDQTCNNI